ncbi:DUF2442 domain-containing protein [Leptolyngbya sp. 15MV]|nr:DUF2442 domain-containing protein [Leptolyngbya sp. 15MV]
MNVARIASLETLPGPQLRLRFADAATGLVDLARLAERGGVFAALQTRAPRIVENGRAIAWDDPDGQEADMDADTLRRLIEHVRAAAE